LLAKPDGMPLGNTLESWGMEERSYYERVRDIVERTSDGMAAATQAGGDGAWRRRVNRALRVGILLVVVAAAGVYAGDYVVLRCRMASGRGAVATVEVERYIAIQKKANRTEFSYDGTETQTCVNSWFPHAGHSACWYLRRHREKRIEL
jgi:hypothetical protein